MLISSLPEGWGAIGVSLLAVTREYVVARGQGVSLLAVTQQGALQRHTMAAWISESSQVSSNSSSIYEVTSGLDLPVAFLRVPLQRLPNIRSLLHRSVDFKPRYGAQSF